MTATKRPTSTRKKRSRKKPQNKVVFYVAEIESWDWGFLFGLAGRPREADPYHDFRHLTLKGKLLRPSKYEGQSIEMRCIPDPDLNAGAREERSPIAAGSIDIYGGEMSALFGVPLDVLPSLLTMLTAEKLRYAILQGGPMRYRKTSLTSIRLEMNITEDDLWEEE